MPQKLDDCVAKVKGEKGVDNPWAICNASIGKETKEGADILNIHICVSFWGMDSKNTNI